MLLTDPAWGRAQEPVKAGPLDERNPAAASTYLDLHNYVGWSRNSAEHPGRYNAFVQPEGEAPIRLNAPGTKGWMGGIYDDVAVYQQVYRGRSDIKAYGLVSGGRWDVAHVNTRYWEWRPTMWGNYILFGRVTPTEQKILLYDGGNVNVLALDRVSAPGSTVIPGQVDGAFAVWTKCTRRRGCDVYRYNMLSRNTLRIPKPTRRHQYAPSVKSGGRVYFARSGRGCGSSVELLRYMDGRTHELLTLQDGMDVFFTYAYWNHDRQISVFYDRISCRTYEGDIYKIAAQ